MPTRLSAFIKQLVDESDNHSLSSCEVHATLAVAFFFF